MITSPIAGTTVDSVDSTATLGGKEFLLIDYAGIRRKNKTEQGIEVLSVVQTRKALERADVAVGVGWRRGNCRARRENRRTSHRRSRLRSHHRDEQMGHAEEQSEIHERNGGRKDPQENGLSEIRSDDVRERQRRQRLRDLGDLVEEILHQRKLQIQTREFTEWVKKEATIHNPMNAKFYMSHQTGRNPPTFVCHVSDPDKVHFSLRRHMVNALRERWGFMGTPVRLLFVKGASDRAPMRAEERKRLATRKRDTSRRPKKKPTR